ncbi:MAG: SgcJ/EcaC family oxidoreductase [Myxococcota bacterium]|nr:SgcJ/EcaC family oxidoreductase [Myxococcota bacterium]
MTVEELYAQLIDAWNGRDAAAFEALFVLDGDLVGFDGSQLHGQGAIGEHLRALFGDHPTAPYVSRITGVTQISTDVAIVRAIAGMVPPGQQELDPKLHAVHRMTAVHRGGAYRVALFQNTPIQLHGRPAEVDAITAELRAVALK